MLGRKVIVLALAVIFLSAIPTLALAKVELTPIEQLGKDLFFDNISTPDWVSCATCHAPDVGWTGPIPGINLFGAVYRGAIPTRFGNRKPPTVAYGGNSPLLHYDAGEGGWVGGMFWDGRATGWTLGDPLAEQALGPFLNPVEMNMPSAQAVLEQVAAAKYAGLWEEVWGEPISTETEEDIDKNYERIGRAIAAYERSLEVSQFSSKYDYYLNGEVELTEQEAWGLELFNGKAKCFACHPSQPGAGGEPPLFTDFTFDNLGIPQNPYNPFYDTDPDFIDYGLGDFLKSLEYGSEVYEPELGKHKVPTLRNVDKRPGEKFPKAYGHNGFFKSLEEIVHFYNTRDVEDWPPSEVLANVNFDELGNLGLLPDEEEAIVAFMKTLSDGYKPKKK